MMPDSLVILLSLVLPGNPLPTNGIAPFGATAIKYSDDWKFL